LFEIVNVANGYNEEERGWRVASGERESTEDRPPMET
jgi:hypothetical protein